MMGLSGIWYKVEHPWFNPGWAYQAVAYTNFSETAWAQITFILPTGHTVAVQNWRCTALPRSCEQRWLEGASYARPMTETERLFPRAVKLPPNPDLDVDYGGRRGTPTD
jgi:hypothetical protein